MENIIICGWCGHREFASDDMLKFLPRSNSAPVPARADGITSDTVERRPKATCPNCGRQMKIIPNTWHKPEEKKEKPDRAPLDYLSKFEKEVLINIRSKNENGDLL